MSGSPDLEEGPRGYGVPLHVRRRWDSNPWVSHKTTGLSSRRLSPLGHASAACDATRAAPEGRPWCESATLSRAGRRGHFSGLADEASGERALSSRVAENLAEASHRFVLIHRNPHCNWNRAPVRAVLGEVGERPHPDVLEGLDDSQLELLTQAHDLTHQMLHIRAQLSTLATRARYHGCSLEQLAVVMGITPEGVEHILRVRPGQWAAIHPKWPTGNPASRAYRELLAAEEREARRRKPNRRAQNPKR